MKTVTAKELKNRTGEILRNVGRGGKVLVTRRGKPFAVLSPVQKPSPERADLRPFEEAWSDLDETLRETSPHHRTWQEAMRWSRRRG